MENALAPKPNNNFQLFFSRFYYFNITAHTIRSEDPRTKQLTKNKLHKNANGELRRNSHHSHHNLFEIVLDIPHVRDGLRAEYERNPRAQFVLISQTTEKKERKSVNVSKRRLCCEIDGEEVLRNS